jgi:ABC-type amino acid transport system permease subunit
MDERLASALRVLPDYLGQHVLLSASALAFGVVLSLPLALVAARRPRWRWPLLTLASAVQTIPGLALLALFYPLLLELWRELGDDGELKAAYRGGCRACQNLQKERYAYEHVYQRCPPSSA